MNRRLELVAVLCAATGALWGCQGEPGVGARSTWDGSETAPEVVPPDLGEFLNDPLLREALAALRAQDIPLELELGSTPPDLGGAYSTPGGIVLATSNNGDEGIECIGNYWTLTPGEELDVYEVFQQEPGRMSNTGSAVVRGNMERFTDYRRISNGDNLNDVLEINVGTVDAATGDLLNVYHIRLYRNTDCAGDSRCDDIAGEDGVTGSWLVFRYDRVTRTGDPSEFRIMPSSVIAHGASGSSLLSLAE